MSAMLSIPRFATVLVLAGALLAGCTTSPAPEARAGLLQQATATLQDMQRMDATVDSVIRSGYGYAIFPEVVKAGLALGGGYGQGVVYEQGQHVGFADLTLGSIGAQIGGQTFREVIVFQNKAAMDRFKLSPVDFTAGAAAMILQQGAAANAQFIEGVAVLVQPITGAMAEATIGGQQFKFVPK
jgi:lipid-binding SYLF domain-containing protein